MAFKLIDNPGSSDNKRKQRNRVANLISNGIPKNEYQMNQSGKIACIVCPSWPVFDTFPMLASHRTSIKHQNHKTTWDAHLLNKLFQEDKRQQKNVTAYNSQKMNRQELPLIMETRNVVNKLNDTSSTSSLVLSSVCQDGGITIQGENFGSGIQPGGHDEIESLITRVCQGGNEGKDLPSSRVTKGNVPTAVSQSEVKSFNSKMKRPGQTIEKTIAAKSVKLEYELRMRQSGWVKDSCGKWIKDENCEFDSDEEPPLE